MRGSVNDLKNEMKFVYSMASLADAQDADGMLDLISTKKNFLMSMDRSNSQMVAAVKDELNSLMEITNLIKDKKFDLIVDDLVERKDQITKATQHAADHHRRHVQLMKNRNQMSLAETDEAETEEVTTDGEPTETATTDDAAATTDDSAATTDDSTATTDDAATSDAAASSDATASTDDSATTDPVDTEKKSESTS
jgi:hypothetical protein